MKHTCKTEKLTAYDNVIMGITAADLFCTSLDKQGLKYQVSLWVGGDTQEGMWQVEWTTSWVKVPGRKLAWGSHD